MCFTTRARRSARHQKSSLLWHFTLHTRTKARANLVVVRVKNIIFLVLLTYSSWKSKTISCLTGVNYNYSGRFLLSFFSHRLLFKMFMSWLHCAHIIFIGCIPIVVVWHAPSCHKDCDYSTFSPTFTVDFFRLCVIFFLLFLFATINKRISV